MGDLDETLTAAVERAGQSRLNSLIALCVALAATCMALDNIKDGNVTQNMSQTQARGVDAWSYYQAKSMKQNLAESTLDQLQATRESTAATGPALASLDKRIADYKAQVTRYDKEKADIKAQAEGFQKQYDDLNQHDDQFDLSDAAFSVAIALLGVTALTRKRWLFGMAAVFLGVGFVFALAGFFGWAIHPDAMMSWLS